MARAASTALLILFCALSVHTTTPARAAGFAVDSALDAVDATPGDGLCATIEGDCTLRAALQETNALPGADTISLPPEAYQLAITGSEEDAAATGDLDILDDVTITGVDAATTIVDGGGLDRVVDVDPLMTGVDVQLVGLTLRNGDASEGGGLRNGAANLALVAGIVTANTADAGGGIVNRTSASLELQDMLIEGNHATVAGGLRNSGTTVGERAVFTANTATDDGGAVINFGSLELANSEFNGNISGDNGGAFWGDGTLSLVDSTLINNTAADEGGAIVSFGGHVTLTRSTVADNRADRLRGGGLVNFAASTMTLIDTTVHNNTAVTNGGGILNNGTMTLERSTVDANTAGANGGGIHGDAGSSLSALNSTIAGNSAAAGGGISNGGDADIKYSTVAFNVGAGLANTGSLYVRGALFAMNDRNCATRVPSSGGHNLDTGVTCDFHALGDVNFAEAELQPLLPGLTATYPLGPGSEAIDAGGMDCPPPATDQPGVARPQGAACDIGAYEVEQEAPPAGDVNNDGRVDSVDAALILQYTAGLLDALVYPAAADVDHDGRIDSIDASLVLQHAAGLLDSLPA